MVTQLMCTHHAAEPAVPSPSHDPTDVGVHGTLGMWGCGDVEGKGREAGKVGMWVGREQVETGERQDKADVHSYWEKHNLG